MISSLSRSASLRMRFASRLALSLTSLPILSAAITARLRSISVVWRSSMRSSRFWSSSRILWISRRSSCRSLAIRSRKLRTCFLLKPFTEVANSICWISRGLSFIFGSNSSSSLSGLYVKRAEPTLTMVAPSSIATSKSPLMPIDNSFNPSLSRRLRSILKNFRASSGSSE